MHNEKKHAVVPKCSNLLIIQEVITLAETLSGVNGEILRWAREFYNMNAEDAAKAIGVDVERYCNWEAETDHPTYP